MSSTSKATAVSTARAPSTVAEGPEDDALVRQGEVHRHDHGRTLVDEGQPADLLRREQAQGLGAIQVDDLERHATWPASSPRVQSSWSLLVSVSVSRIGRRRARDPDPRGGDQGPMSGATAGVSRQRHLPDEPGAAFRSPYRLDVTTGEPARTPRCAGRDPARDPRRSPRRCRRPGPATPGWSGSPVTVKETREASACLATLVSDSRTTASTSARRSSGTRLSSGPTKVTRGSEPSISDSRRPPRTTRSAGSDRPALLVLQGEDGGPDVGDRGVQRVDVADHPLRHALISHPTQRALQTETDGEDPLDDVVVEITRDPVRSV